MRPKEGEEGKFQESLAFESEETDSVEKRREWSERCLGEQGLRGTLGICGWRGVGAGHSREDCFRARGPVNPGTRERDPA